MVGEGSTGTGASSGLQLSALGVLPRSHFPFPNQGPVPLRYRSLLPPRPQRLPHILLGEGWFLGVWGGRRTMRCRFCTFHSWAPGAGVLSLLEKIDAAEKDERWTERDEGKEREVKRC